MNPFQQSTRLRIVPVALRVIAWGGLWSLLADVTQAAETFHESAGEHLLHFVGMHLNTVMTAVWVFVLGACIGSFLNVVIYRMPAGLALTHPGSRCPAYETELTARDNIPILGWLTLRGRCRYCQIPISSRYPLIESVVGLLFLLLLLVETRTGATNLPLRTGGVLPGGALDAIFRFGRWDLLAYFAFHAFYLTLALGVCMIGFDGHVPPRKLIRLGVLVALTTTVFLPGLRPVHTAVPLPEPLRQAVGGSWTLPEWLGSGTLTAGVSLVGLVDGVTGLISGLVTGWLAGKSAGGNTAITATLRGVLLLAGCFCGWQLTWPLLTVLLIGITIVKLVGRAGIPPWFLLFLFAACCGFLYCWSRLVNGMVLIRYDGWQWTSASGWVDWAITIPVLVALALLLSRWTSTSPVPVPDDVAGDIESPAMGSS